MSCISLPSDSVYFTVGFFVGLKKLFATQKIIKNIFFSVIIRCVYVSVVLYIKFFPVIVPKNAYGRELLPTGRWERIKAL